MRVDFLPAGAFGEMVVTHGRLSLMSAHIGCYLCLRAESQTTKNCSVHTMVGALKALGSAQPSHRVAMPATRAPGQLFTNVLSSKVN